MTSPSTQDQALVDLMATARLILLDFDGPICSVFAGYPAGTIAAELLTELARYGELTAAEAAETDPMAVLRASSRFPKPATERIEDTLQVAEGVAIDSATPTPGADDFLKECTRVGLEVFVVTNNSLSAAWDYLIDHELDYHVTDVFGRRRYAPHLMKPNPFLLDEVIKVRGGDRAGVVMIGDSESDIQAAQAASVRSIGYANKPDKAHRLAAAGANVVITHMAELTAAAGLRPEVRPLRRSHNPITWMVRRWPFRRGGHHRISINPDARVEGTHLRELVHRLELDHTNVLITAEPDGRATLTWDRPGRPTQGHVITTESDLARAVAFLGQQAKADLWPDSPVVAGFNLLLVHVDELLDAGDPGMTVHITAHGAQRG